MDLNHAAERQAANGASMLHLEIGETELRATLARQIVAARRANQRRNGNVENQIVSLELNDIIPAAEDPQSVIASDRALFEEDVNRIRNFLKILIIHTRQQLHHIHDATGLAPPGAGGQLPRTGETQVAARGHPLMTIAVRFTTMRPVPSHTARGTRRPPTLVFCLPPVLRDPTTYVETLPRPRIDSLEEKCCNVCREPFKTDGPVIGAGIGESGDTWMHHSRPEIPVQLPCKHVFGSHCLATWFTPSANKSCPLCREKIPELDNNFQYQQLRKDVQEALFNIARLMAQQGQISGFEFTYGHTNNVHPEILRLKIPRDT